VPHHVTSASAVHWWPSQPTAHEHAAAFLPGEACRVQSAAELWGCWAFDISDVFKIHFQRRKIPIVINNIDALILNQQDTTLEFVKQVYTLLTERQLMPPIKIYETLQQSNGDANAMGGADRANRGDEFDFFKKDDEVSKKEGQSAHGAGSVDAKNSP